MRRIAIALAAIAAGGLAVTPLASAKSHHRSSHARKVSSWEHRFHFKLTKANRNRDADHDGVTNAGECAHGTDPLHKNNHTATAATVTRVTPATATTPIVLVITLPDGTTETGAVTNRTEIKCRTAPPATTTPTTPTTPTAPATTRRHGDNNDNDQGDDNGNDANDNDQGDNRGGHQGNSGPGSSDNRGGQQGDDNGNDQNDNDDNNAMCSTADLTVGAAVNEARLKVTADGPVFDEIVLVK